VQGAGGSSIVDRMLGFLMLNDRVIKDVERDTNATSQALVVVVLAAIAGAIGAIGGQENQNLVASLLFGAISSIAGWIVFSVIAYFVGATLFATSQTSVTIGQVLRVVGFAQTPKLIGVLGFIPVLGGIASLVAWIWFIVVAIVAIRTAFEFSTERAIGTSIVALIVQVLVVALIALVVALVIGIPLAILDWIF
jgi:hypothetical protein